MKEGGGKEGRGGREEIKEGEEGRREEITDFDNNLFVLKGVGGEGGVKEVSLGVSFKHRNVPLYSSSVIAAADDDDTSLPFPSLLFSSFPFLSHPFPSLPFPSLPFSSFAC